jgi:hypothetical protein
MILIISPKSKFLSFLGKGVNLTKDDESFLKEVKKGEGDEENHYTGSGFSDDAIYWRMLGRVGCRRQGWERWRLLQGCRS